MRVITGSARGAKLKTLEGLATRPTSDRVKEAVFNIIQFDIEGRRVLDLFAGSGQLAIEALSRGAEYAVLVDQSQEATKVIKENLKKVKFDQKASVFQMDYLRYLATSHERFDIIFLDPPYAEKSLENALQKISEIDILSEGGIIVCERSREKVLPARVGDLICSKDYCYGKTAVNLYSR
jgi:16S rRNA (guanine(966)-N(2))-methyltransferase RsmD